MVRYIHAVRKEQIAKMVHKTLGSLFLTKTATLFGNAFISVADVEVDSKGSVARVYLSFALNDNREELLSKVEYQKNTIRRWLGTRLAGKMRKIPDLKFCMDDIVIRGAHVTALIDQLSES